MVGIRRVLRLCKLENLLNFDFKLDFLYRHGCWCLIETTKKTSFQNFSFLVDLTLTSLTWTVQSIISSQKWYKKIKWKNLRKISSQNVWITKVYFWGLFDTSFSLFLLTTFHFLNNKYIYIESFHIHQKYINLRFFFI